MKREVSAQSPSRQALLPNGASASLSSPPSTNSTGPIYVDTLPNDEEKCDLKKLKKHKARQYSVTAIHLPSNGTSSQGSYPLPLNRHHSSSKEVSSKENFERTAPSLTMDLSSPGADSLLGEPVRLSEPTPKNQSSALASISHTLLSEAPILFNHPPPKSKQYHASARRRSSSALPSLTLPSAVLLTPNSVIMKNSSPTIEMTSICVEGEIYCNSSGTSTPVSPGSPCFARTTTSPMNVYPDHLSSKPSIMTTSNPPKLHSIADSQSSNISCTDNQNTRQNTITRRRSVRKPASTMSKIPIRRSITFLSPQDSLSHSSSLTSLPSGTFSSEASTTKSSSSLFLSSSSSSHSDTINSSILNHNYDNNNLASRPPLHIYTSFETTFDLRPPPSPPQNAGKLPNTTDRCHSHKSVTESNSSASGGVSGILVGVGSWW